MVTDDARLVNSLIVVKLPFSPSLKFGPYVINDLETPNEYKSVAKWKRNCCPLNNDVSTQEIGYFDLYLSLEKCEKVK